MNIVMDHCVKLINFKKIHYLALIDLKRVFEKAGMAKTHLELVKIINEVAPGKEQIMYEDFITMILGKQNSVLKL